MDRSNSLIDGNRLFHPTTINNFSSSSIINKLLKLNSRFSNLEKVNGPFVLQLQRTIFFHLFVYRARLSFVTYIHRPHCPPSTSRRNKTWEHARNRRMCQLQQVRPTNRANTRTHAKMCKLRPRKSACDATYTNTRSNSITQHGAAPRGRAPQSRCFLC